MSQISEQLTDEFQRRCVRNSNYSLRSFARAVGVSHTLLSLIMNNKRKPSQKFIKKIESALPQKDSSKPNPRREMSVEDFSRISTWIHYGILSYLDFPNATLDSKRLAELFGVSSVVIKQAVADLKRLGVIELSESGRWRQKGLPISVNNKSSNSYCTAFISQYLEKAHQSMDVLPFELRDLKAITFAMNTHDLDYARNRITEFRRELCDELEKRSTPNVVVAFNTNLFSLSKLEG